MKSKISTTLLVSILIISACSKMEDRSIPNVWISAPTAGSEIQVGDTFFVKGGFSDKAGINFLRIQLVDMYDEYPVTLASKSFKRLQNYNFNFPCSITDENLPSGDYYIKAIAYNEWNVSNAFVDIDLTETPLKFQKVYVFTSQSSFSIRLNKLQDSVIHFINDYPGEYIASSINSDQRQIYLAHQNNIGRLSAIDVESNTVNWVKEAGQPYPSITDLITDEKYIYYSTENGEINSLFSDGNTKVITPFNNDTFPERITVFEDYIISDSKTRIGGNHVLMIYFKETGVFSHCEQSNLDVMGFHPFFGDKLLTFGNKNNTGMLEIYDPYQRYMDHMSDFNFEISNTLKINSDTYLLNDSSWIYKYFPSSNSFSTFLQIDGIITMKYEPLNNSLYIGKNNHILVYDYSEAQLIHEIDINGKVHDFEFLYNKTP